MTRKTFRPDNKPIPTTVALLKQTLLVLLITGFVAGCGAFKLERPAKPVEEKSKFSFGLGIFGGGNTSQTLNSEQELGVNGFIWQATLDALSFMPMTSADPIGGIVITDWYQSRSAPKQEDFLGLLFCLISRPPWPPSLRFLYELKRLPENALDSRLALHLNCCHH